MEERERDTNMKQNRKEKEGHLWNNGKSDYQCLHSSKYPVLIDG